MTDSASLSTSATPIDVCRALRARQDSSLYLDGEGFEDGWSVPRLAALSPRIFASHRPGQGRRASADAIDAVTRVVEARRAQGGTAETGVALLLGYEFGHPAPSVHRDDDGLPDLVALSVDRSLRFLPEGVARITVRADDRSAVDARIGSIAAWLENLPIVAPRPVARVTGPVTTSLPRHAYLASLGRIHEHIARGDIYQANLCQRFDAGCEGDGFEYYARLAALAPAPLSAFFEVPGLGVCSISPERFLRIDGDGWIETLPIKGTRARSADPVVDAARAEELLASEKDRAELLMIVDLERNDLGRVCRVGSIEVPELARLHSYSTVHHLVARVRGRLRRGVSLPEVLRATFPGGSITGAPKESAMRLLEGFEPRRRNFFTGSLFWFGDDGTTDSSILIRTAVLGAGRVFLGAGGGIVTDSDPEREWEESNHKARAPAEQLGFQPEDAR